MSITKYFKMVKSDRSKILILVLLPNKGKDINNIINKKDNTNDFFVCVILMIKNARNDN